MSNNYSWTGEVGLSALPVFGRIINLQFIKELSDGKLLVEKFRSYIAQDELYLGNYGRQMFESRDLQSVRVEQDIAKRIVLYQHPGGGKAVGRYTDSPAGSL